MAPKNTPAAVVAKINADVKTILDKPKVASSLQRLGIYSDTANIGTPEALTAYIR